MKAIINGIICIAMFIAFLYLLAEPNEGVSLGVFLIVKLLSVVALIGGYKAMQYINNYEQSR